MNKPVMSQVTAQIATEQSEKAVELRDKGDIAGARKVLEDNAAYIKRSRETYSAGCSGSAVGQRQGTSDLEKKNTEAANSLDDANWNKARKAMRYDQHKAKVQQPY